MLWLILLILFVGVALAIFYYLRKTRTFGNTLEIYDFLVKNRVFSNEQFHQAFSSVTSDSKELLQKLLDDETIIPFQPEGESAGLSAYIPPGHQPKEIVAQLPTRSPLPRSRLLLVGSSF